MTEIATERMITLRLADGEERTAELMEDGSWSCPWDGTPCIPGEEHYESRPWEAPCPSPACMAGGRSDLASVLAVKLEAQRRAEAAERQSWLVRATEEQRARREASRQEAVAAFAELAAEEEYCVPCWNHSTQYGLYPARPRLIRHRASANCPQRRKGRS